MRENRIKLCVLAIKELNTDLGSNPEYERGQIKLAVDLIGGGDETREKIEAALYPKPYATFTHRYSPKKVTVSDPQELIDAALMLDGRTSHWMLEVHGD